MNIKTLLATSTIALSFATHAATVEQIKQCAATGHFMHDAAQMRDQGLTQDRMIVIVNKSAVNMHATDDQKQAMLDAVKVVYLKPQIKPDEFIKILSDKCDEISK